MKIAIIGSGYVGLVAGACFAEMGNNVKCIDKDEKKINNLNNGIIPIYEPGLTKLIKDNIKKENISFYKDFVTGINEVEIVFIAVGTPMGDNGSADLKHVLTVAKEIGQKMQNDLIVVNKSTVPVGTADKVRDTIKKELKVRNSSLYFDVVSNPEFLKEGAAINDFMKPDRIVVGANNEDSINRMKKLYSPFFRTNDRFIAMDIRSSEMSKYAANAMLATKISFMNEIANICEKVGADVNSVRIGIGSDKRIGYSFIYPGCGYGGSCFPKDVSALNKLSSEVNYKAELINAVENVNNRQKHVISNKVIERFGENLNDYTFTVWGLSFKPETNDMREAPSIYVIKDLIKKGAKINAYDPKATPEAKNIYLKNFGVKYFETKYDAINGSNAIIILTEWKEFRCPDFDKMKDRLKHNIIFDGRNIYNDFDLKSKGWEYHQIGKSFISE
tara:strand:- start:903 stop:2237 length:1335 start_codon:yes stop_codon:yes gene_type:complete